MSYRPEPGVVYFVGAGPGAPDLITLRGRDIIARADLVLYADSLVQESVAHLARKPGVRIAGSSDLHLEQMVRLMVEAARAGGVVARVHTGDPSLYGATHEQMTLLAAQGVPCEVVPGVTAAFAAAARLGVELTRPEQVQTLIFSRIAGRTPMPEREALHRLAAHGASLALYLSIGQIEQVVTDLLAGGAYPPHTPAAVVYKVTWPDEHLIIGTLADIAEKVRAAGYTRHALILVGPTLRPSVSAPRSHLYDRSFAHGCRAAAPPDSSPPSPHPAIIAVTRSGSTLAARLAHPLDGVVVVPARFAGETDRGYPGAVSEEICRCWDQHRQLVLIMAAGVAVRALAPLLHHKSDDPAVVCLDEAGRSVIPLLGGHQAGANDLARHIAAITGGHAAITTASDVQHRPALDLLGKEAGWQIDPDSALTHASASLVNGDPLGLFVDPALPAVREQVLTWLAPAENVVEVAHPDDLRSETYAAGLLVTHRLLSGSQRPLLNSCVLYHPPALVVGVGSRRGVAAEEVRDAIETTLHEAGLALASVAALATADLKSDEPGIRQAAADLGVPLQVIARTQLEAFSPDDFNPSAAQEHFGLPGVAEPCAVLAAGGDPSALLVPKHRFARCTVAVALTQGSFPAPPPPPLALVSLGPGDPQQMTLAAREALTAAEVIIGYQSYLEQVRPLLSPHQEVIAHPMQSELARAQQAIELAAAGRRVALISSGDIGMYAMAGPLFELLHQRGHSGNRPEVVVLPGVSAFQAAAARVGGAINHDLCTISLSDLLTPWEVIERRLLAAAEGDFVLALYNPRSKGRTWQLARACAIIRTHRPPDTPVVLARSVTRPDEQIIRTTLAAIDPAQADMLTVVLVGNRQSYWSGELLVTPRGYHPSPVPDVPPAPTPDHPATYPINLSQMMGTPVVVVGGGAVGERKVRGLLAVGAHIILISPDATPQLREWAAAGCIVWEQRPYQTGDLANRPALVFAATSERAVNARIAQDASTHGLRCNVADVPHEGNFHLPAVYREDGLVVAFSTEGVSPARARRVRDGLAELLQQEHERQHDDG
ncbi:MAG: precorrin-4 C(11)-methyltransferase [Chloroflexaceae bacterium]|nr:precorrin-4 C(11)-methyltransferase [Chloroflexaceae bacterium]